LNAYVLEVAQWAAIVDATEELGVAATAAVIPDQQRRRLPRFARDVLRCALPLLHAAAGAPVVLCSPNGDLASTLKLLTNVVQRELLSPSLFALSVHNAAAGALSLALSQPGDQTAIAGDAGTLSAGLIEAYTRLRSGEAASIVLVYADERLPSVYAGLEPDDPGIVVAMALKAPDADASGVGVGGGRAGALNVVRALQQGRSHLAFAASKPARAA
jgi:hypothetical protein